MSHKNISFIYWVSDVILIISECGRGDISFVAFFDKLSHTLRLRAQLVSRNVCVMLLILLIKSFHQRTTLTKSCAPIGISTLL